MPAQTDFSEDPFSLCLVGAGNMGGAMLAGWLANGFDPARITVIDPAPNPAMAQLLDSHGITARKGAPGGMSADVLLIAVKPQLMESVLPQVAPLAGEGTVSVSVAAGTMIATLRKHLARGAVVRAMPNTPALLGKGITVACADQATGPVQRQRAGALLAAIGGVEWIEDEALMDAVTAVSGSGPAYAFLLAECMAAAGVEQGLPPALAERLARETVAGAGAMLSQLPEPASRLRENVTSPNGTTAAALSVFMAEGGMRELVSRAVAEAAKRSAELSRD